MNDDFITIDLFEWMEEQMNSPEGRETVENLALRKLRLDDRSANDESEMWTIFNRLNELCFMADDENKIEAIGNVARAGKARRISALQKEFAECRDKLIDILNEELK